MGINSKGLQSTNGSMKILNCIVCGKEFVKVTDRKTCSEQCYRTHYNAKMVERRRRINGTKEIPCRFCRDIFLPKKRDLKICDKEECKRLARLEASKQYRQSERGKEKRRNLENGIRAQQRALDYNGKAVNYPRINSWASLLGSEESKVL